MKSQSWFAFILLALAKVIATYYSFIQDCDEVFNYWEALHYYTFGIGFQTWEYVPAFSLRSWTYISIYGLFGELLSLLDMNKVSIFYATKLVMAGSSLISEYWLVKSVARLNQEISNYLLLFLLVSPGMFISSNAFLPSTFAMNAATVAFSYSLLPSTRLNMFWIVLSVTIGGLVGWPFCLAYGFVYAHQKLIEGSLHKDFSYLVQITIVSVSIVVLPLFLIDSAFYEEWTLPPLNLVLYNVFAGDDRGPALYGTEPWWFYIANGILNFNIVFLMALLSLPMVLTLNFTSYSAKLTNISSLIPFYAFLAIFSAQPHKEERFMFVVFPILCFNAAVSLFAGMKVVQALFLKFKPIRQYDFYASNAIKYVSLLVFIILAIGRNVALHKFYAAPMQIYQSLPSNEFGTLCLGKEWYRFPSHYFIPPGVSVEFIESNFNGLLPTKFNPSNEKTFNSTTEYGAYMKSLPRVYATAPEHINDLNKPEKDRYVDIDQCDYLIDTIPKAEYRTSEDPKEPYYGLKPEWYTINCLPFLDATRTKFPARAFYFGKKVYVDYCLYKRI